MAFKRINAISFMADNIEDLKDLPISKMGAECFVIENGKEYKCNSRGEWINPNNAPGNEYNISGMKRINAISFMIDNEENLKDIPESKMGSSCYCIANDTNYICNSKGEWIQQPANTFLSIDSSLTKANEAADAQAVGKAINNILQVPSYTEEDNEKFLRIIDGNAKWSFILESEEVGF